MHVLYLAQFYNEPKDPGAGRHYAQVRSLVDRGHRVTVITGQENYRSASIPEEYSGRFMHREERDGVTILRTWVLTGHRRHFALRYVNHLSFLFSGLWAGLRGDSPDVVIASSPPLFVAVAGALLAKLRRAPLVTDIRDLWPESVVAMKLAVNPLLVKGGFGIAGWVYGNSRHLIAVTEGIASGLRARGVPAERITWIPNGVDLDLYDDVQADESLRSDHGLSEKFLCVYVGGMGPVHNVGTLVETARLLRNEAGIHFLLVGDGGEKPRLVESARDLENVTFLDSIPKSRVPAVLSTGDVCIYSLRNDPFFRGTFPNKNFDYLASARPVILAVEGESRRLVENAGAGIVVTPESAAEMADAIRRMAGLPREERDAMGAAGRRYVLENFHRRLLGARLADIVESIGEQSQPRLDADGS